MPKSWAGKKVALLYGGTDSEREVSLKTGAAFREALVRMQADIIDLDFNAASVATLAQQPVDVALIALHGRIGEGGAVQGLLECLSIPYTGSGLLASTVAMDKTATKKMFRDAQVPTPDGFEITGPDDVRLQDVALPVVVKPPTEGSSVGISIAHTREALEAAVQEALRYGGRALVEQFVKGRELSIGFFDDEVLEVMEIVPASGVYDFEAKYLRNDTQYLLPAPISSQARERSIAADYAAWQAIECRGVGRVDVLLDENDAPWILELNTVPGMTPTSIIPKMAAQRGWSFDELVARMLDRARLYTQTEGDA